MSDLSWMSDEELDVMTTTARNPGFLTTELARRLRAANERERAHCAEHEQQLNYWRQQVEARQAQVLDEAHADAAACSRSADEWRQRAADAVWQLANDLDPPPGGWLLLDQPWAVELLEDE